MKEEMTAPRRMQRRSHTRFAAWVESDISPDNGNMVVVITEPLSQGH